jgi:type I restriction enzyme S subunit
VTLPTGWEPTLLGDIADFVMGQAPPGSDCNTRGEGTPFVKAGEFGLKRPVIREWTTNPLKMATVDDVLICVVGATAGKLNLGADCAIGRSVAAIRPSAAIHSEFLYPRLKSEVLRLRANSTGTAQGVISKDMIAQIILALPPAAEQRRIVAKLDALTTRLARARVELERTTLLVRTLRGSIIREEMQRLALANGETAAREHFMWASGKFLPMKAQRGGEIPVYGGNGITGWHDEANVQSRTIVVGRVGAQCGNVHVTEERSWITDNAIFAHRISKAIDLDFSLYAFRDAQLIQQAAGTGQPYVNQEALNSVRLPDVDIDAQRRSAARITIALARADRLEAEAARASALLDRLESAILAKAFRGELVPQDPNDEPAHVLLDRIRAERAAAPKAKRSSKANADA